MHPTNDQDSKSLETPKKHPPAQTPPRHYDQDCYNDHRDEDLNYYDDEYAADT